MKSYGREFRSLLEQFPQQRWNIPAVRHQFLRHAEIHAAPPVKVTLRLDQPANGQKIVNHRILPSSSHGSERVGPAIQHPANTVNAIAFPGIVLPALYFLPAVVDDVQCLT